ncbi:hypothetical protein HF086_004012 [Spodoptera exigua]|uniref:Uncharacterized protein n=1 Tax=Spodoptera exigua TaxID=7107 RepID=A0A922SA30_SPOEX|nr:hypothetical protein HF086_004012 [Spodoptera exigua]
MSLKIEAETKLDSEPCVLTFGNKLFVGSEDGSIKTFEANLTPKESWTAHAVQPFALATDGDTLYSSSNDGGIRVWSMKGDQITELPSSGADVGALHVFDRQLYAGDEDGNVKESKTRFMTRHTMEGRAPLRISGNRLLFMSRDGNSLRLHDASVDTSFKSLDEVKVSDMILTSLSTSGQYAWTGGWDGVVRRYKMAGDKLEAAGDINLGGCINSLVAAGGSAYVAVSGGKLVHLRAA